MKIIQVNEGWFQGFLWKHPGDQPVGTECVETSMSLEGRIARVVRDEETGPLLEKIQRLCPDAKLRLYTLEEQGVGPAGWCYDHETIGCCP